MAGEANKARAKATIDAYLLGAWRSPNWGPLRSTTGEAPGYGGRHRLYLSAKSGGTNRPPETAGKLFLLTTTQQDYFP